MGVNRLKEKVSTAKEAVKDLDEPLKTKAFELILNRLLNEEQRVAQQVIIQKPNFQDTKSFDEDISDKLSNEIDRTSYPIIYNLQKALDKALYILMISKNDYNVDGLNPSQISKILSTKFRIPTSSNSISMSLMKAGNLVDRKQVNTQGGISYEYRIMHSGEEYLNKILDNPQSKVTQVRKGKSHSNSSGIKTKKPKEGLKERIVDLKENGFFNKPKETKEVKEELVLRGHTYNDDPIRVALLRLVKKNILRRIRDIKDKKNIYKYCNS